jgi:hypothetical protein
MAYPLWKLDEKSLLLMASDHCPIFTLMYCIIAGLANGRKHI